MAEPQIKDPLRSTKYGFLYPRGYVLVVFKDKADAEKARTFLLDGGYAEGEVEIADSERFELLTRQHLNDGSTVTRIFGTEHESEARYLQLAKEGHVFLLAYSPTELDAERLMRVVQRFDFVLADKFDRLSILHMRNEPA
jgi:hypothetical protein